MNCCENTAIAAEKNHLDCIKKLRSEGYKWSPWTIEIAAQKGHLECLKYLHENGCRWDIYTTFYAATKGSLEWLKHACEAGCPWNYYTTFAASKYGHLECLKYSHENGAEWHEETTFYAAFHNHLDCLLYCLENDCPIDPETLDKLYTSQTNKNLLTNIKLRKILLHPRIKNDITNKYPKFIKAIKYYEKYKNNVYTLVASETNLPTDVIKYEIIKYI